MNNKLQKLKILFKDPQLQNEFTLLYQTRLQTELVDLQKRGTISQLKKERDYTF